MIRYFCGLGMLFCRVGFIALLVILFNMPGCKTPDPECTVSMSTIMANSAIGDEVPCYAARCPICSSQSQWTGQTQIIDAKIWYKMKCPRNHHFLAASPH